MEGSGITSTTKKLVDDMLSPPVRLNLFRMPMVAATGGPGTVGPGRPKLVEGMFCVSPGNRKLTLNGSACSSAAGTTGIPSIRPT